MDEIALASVITSGVVGVAGVAAAIWTTRENIKFTRRNSVEERRAAAYLEVLQTAALRHLGVEAATTTLSRLHRDTTNHVPMDALPEPSAADWGRMGALLEAYGSANVTASYKGWRDAYAEFEVKARVMTKALGMDERFTFDDDLRSELKPLEEAENAAFERLVALVVEELNTKSG